MFKIKKLTECQLFNNNGFVLSDTAFVFKLKGKYYVLRGEVIFQISKKEYWKYRHNAIADEERSYTYAKPIILRILYSRLLNASVTEVQFPEWHSLVCSLADDDETPRESIGLIILKNGTVDNVENRPPTNWPLASQLEQIISNTKEPIHAFCIEEEGSHSITVIIKPKGKPKILGFV